jgi:NADH-quinone oxidoreductase subunit J
MNLYDIIFYLFAAITLVSAFFVVTTKNVIYSAYNLLLTFFGVAGIYVLLGADFIAIVQLIIYVGGILILMLFGVMLTNKITNVSIKTEASYIIPSSIVVGLFAGILIATLVNTNWKLFPAEPPIPTARSLGFLLMNEYIIVFELLGVLLLIALIGAASIARSK